MTEKAKKERAAARRHETMVARYGPNYRQMLAKKRTETIKKRYGANAFQTIGRMGAAVTNATRHAGQFAAGTDTTKQRASQGGKRSRRGPGKSIPSLDNFPLYYVELDAKEIER